MKIRLFTMATINMLFYDDKKKKKTRSKHIKIKFDIFFFLNVVLKKKKSPHRKIYIKSEP